jgi:hypothetical protein
MLGTSSKSAALYAVPQIRPQFVADSGERQRTIADRMIARNADAWSVSGYNGERRRTPADDIYSALVAALLVCMIRGDGRWHMIVEPRR